MTLLRAMSPEYSTDEAILQAFYETEDVDSADSKAASRLEGRVACGDVVDPTTGEVLVDSGATISKVLAQVLADAGNLGSILVIKDTRDQLILQSLQEDPTADHESALCASTSGCGRATRPSSRRRASCSTRSSSTPTDTGWARWAGSGSTASSTRLFPKTG